MRYYLDFDRTVFDTESWKAYMRARPGMEALASVPDEEMSATLAGMAHRGEVSYAPGELSHLLFPDAAQFLRDKENAVTILTFGDPVLQELKAKSALYGIPRMSVMYTGDVLKGAYLAPHTHLHHDALAVDDLPVQLESLAEGCPPLALYEMRRDGEAGDGRWPVIRSLAELP
jgi:hypothetical protein